MSLKRALPFLFLASLGLALTGAVLLMASGITANAAVLLAVGLIAAVGIGVRAGGIGKLGGMDEREVSAAIHERAQRNLDMAKGRSPQA